MKKILLFVLTSLLLPFAAHAQLNVSLEGNGQWYVDDSKIKLTGNDTSDRIRSNAYLKVDYSIKNWDFGAQVESYLPKALLNYSPELQGINVGALYARYHNTTLGLDITGGHLYEQFGSGLIFRTWEDRQLGINNSILGGRIAYMPIDGITLTALAGKQRIGMGFDLSDGTIYAANLDASITQLLSVSDFNLDAGFSFVGRYESPPAASSDPFGQKVSPEAPNMVNAFSGRFNFSMSGFYAGAEYVYRGNDVLVSTMGNPSPNVYSGQALLLNLGYTQKGLGVDINLRRLENMGFYSQRDLAGNEFNTGVLNYLPALTKQYDYSLQNIYLYQAQPYLQIDPPTKAGEIGGQFDLIYEFKKGSFLGGKYGTNVAINASYWAALDADFDIMNRTYTSNFFGFGEKLYNDLGVEIRKRCSKDFSFILMYLNQYYNKGYIESGSEDVYTNALTGEATYKFGKAQSIKLELQHLWVIEKYLEWNSGITTNVERNSNWVGAGLEYTLNYHWSVFVSDIYNYGNEDENKKVHYYNAGISFVQGATRIAASYGRQRGGLLCVGGVCRTVPESSGLTLNITTAF